MSEFSEILVKNGLKRYEEISNETEYGHLPRGHERHMTRDGAEEFKQIIADSVSELIDEKGPQTRTKLISEIEKFGYNKDNLNSILHPENTNNEIKKIRLKKAISLTRLGKGINKIIYKNKNFNVSLYYKKEETLKEFLSSKTKSRTKTIKILHVDLD